MNINFRGLYSSIVGLILLTTWIAGVVISKGFWSCLFSIFIPFWAWYLVIEKFMISQGWA